MAELVRTTSATPVAIIYDTRNGPINDRKGRGIQLGPAIPVAIVSSNVDLDGGNSSDGDDKSYIYNQPIPETVWLISHNLEKFPSVTIVDSAGTVVVGDVTHNSNMQLTVTFNSAFSGKAYLN